MTDVYEPVSKECRETGPMVLTFGRQQIPFELSYETRKSMRISVHPDLSVKVQAPVTAKTPEIIKKMKTKAPWILRQIDYFESFRPLTPPREFFNGETHLYLGRQYRLKIIPDTIAAVKIKDGRIVIHATDTSPERLRLQLRRWHKQRAEIIFETLLQEALTRFRIYDIPPPRLSIRTMAKRWGSCAPSGKITLNIELIKAPKASILYVITHELCHLIHRNHTAAFFTLQARMMPHRQHWKDHLERLLA